VAQDPYTSPAFGESAESIKDKVSEAAGAVQQASADAYDAVKETVEEQPFLLGVLIGGLVGLALGALWKMNAPPPTFRSYAEPYVRSWRNRDWW
jgi:hypothetical protein